MTAAQGSRPLWAVRETLAAGTTIAQCVSQALRAALHCKISTLAVLWDAFDNQAADDSRRCIFAVAAGGGDLEALQHLHDHGCPWDGSAYVAAVEAGHLQVLHYLLANGCPRDAEACAMAAKCNQMESLRWLRANGCPWDERACTAAAEHGHVEAFAWLHGQGCPMNIDAVVDVATDDVFEWMDEEGVLDDVEFMIVKE